MPSKYRRSLVGLTI